MKRHLILGLGNELMGDDGVGIRVIRELGEPGEGIEVVAGGTAGFSLLEILKGRKKTVVVDAVEMGQAAGVIACFSAAELLAWPTAKSFSLHEPGLLEVLQLGHSLGEDLNHVTIVGIQPGWVSPGQVLSAEVEAQMPLLIEWVKKEVAL